MNKDSERNQYLKVVYDFYDAVISSKESPSSSNDPERMLVRIIDEEKCNTWWKRIIEVFTKKYSTTKVAYSCLRNAWRKKEELKRTLVIKGSPSFDDLWDFCEFIRVCEKVFFYYNDPSQELFVETKMDDPKSSRKIRISMGLDSEVRITLEKSYNMDILTINTVRNFGLKMQNNYRVINEQLEYPDSSDLYLINEINRILIENINNTLDSVINLIAERIDKDRVVWPDY